MYSLLEEQATNDAHNFDAFPGEGITQKDLSDFDFSGNHTQVLTHSIIDLLKSLSQGSKNIILKSQGLWFIPQTLILS